MALDEALMAAVRSGAAPVLRFYRWQPACLSLGRNQPALGRYDLDEIERLGIDVVRRPTGGRGVVHARELTYSVIAGDRDLGGLRESYRTINRALLAGVRRLGVDASMQPPGGGRAASPSTRPCFQGPADGEVVVSGRKLIGSAQFRERGVLLQHGSLLLHDDQVLLRTLQPAGAPARHVRPAVLADHLDPLPSWVDLTGAIVAGWAEILGEPPAAATADRAELEAAERLMTRHLSMEWIWRR